MKISSQTLNLLLDCYNHSCATNDLPTIPYTRDNLTNYQTLAPLAQGAYGDVFVVQHKTTKKIYALKRLSKERIKKQPHASPFAAERSCMIDCRNTKWLVALHTSFQTSTHLYFMMDFYPGGDLLSLLSKLDVLPENEIRFYAGELMLAIEELHSLGYVHRDIKPDNVLITASGHIKLGDFGSCAKTVDGVIVSSVSVGTPDYISPEVLCSINSEAVYSYEVDYWSLGVVIYEMVNGYTPFYSTSLSETYRKINKIEYVNKNGSLEMQEVINNLVCCKTERKSISELKDMPFFNSLNWNEEFKANYIPDKNWNLNFISNEFYDLANEEVKEIYDGFVGFSYDPNVKVERDDSVSEDEVNQNITSLNKKNKDQKTCDIKVDNSKISLENDLLNTNKKIMQNFTAQDSNLKISKEFIYDRINDVNVVKHENQNFNDEVLKKYDKNTSEHILTDQNYDENNLELDEKLKALKINLENALIENSSENFIKEQSKNDTEISQNDGTNEGESFSTTKNNERIIDNKNYNPINAQTQKNLSGTTKIHDSSIINIQNDIKPINTKNTQYDKNIISKQNIRSEYQPFSTKFLKKDNLKNSENNSINHNNEKTANLNNQESSVELEQLNHKKYNNILKKLSNVELIKLKNKESICRIKMYLENIESQNQLVSYYVDHLLSQNKYLKKEIRKKESKIDYENAKFMDDLKKELRQKKMEIKETEQKLNDEANLRHKLEDEIKFLRNNIKVNEKKIDEIKTDVIKREFLCRNIIIDPEEIRNVEFRDTCIKIAESKFIFDSFNENLSNIYVDTLKDNELYFLGEKRRFLVVKVIILAEREETTTHSNKNEDEIICELKKEENILQAIEKVMKVVTGKVLENAEKQKEGSLIRIEQLKGDLRRSKGKSNTNLSGRSNVITEKNKISITEFNNHSFITKTFPAQTICQYCNQLLYGYKDQGFECIECKIVTHKNCYILVKESCEMCKAIRKGNTFYFMMRNIEEKDKFIKTMNK